MISTSPPAVISPEAFIVVVFNFHLLVLVPIDPPLAEGIIPTVELPNTCPVNLIVSPIASPSVVVPSTTRLPSMFALTSTSRFDVILTYPKLPFAAASYFKSSNSSVSLLC